MVSLGEKVPAWGLLRWGGSGLRFVPPDDEGFTLRGDRRRLLYKGRRRSHRFTILGDSSFEYDCILEKEPESNVVTLLMEGAERFDFFRQPDFLKNLLLAGSYAVYKKETRLGEGTGKLCHIHRPQIIDSRGRRVWGDLSVTGNRLCITIPENFLSEAKYPVIVDPVIGCTTIGSQYDKYFIDEEEYDGLLSIAEDEGWSDEQLREELQGCKIILTRYGEAVFNKYTCAETLLGQYTACIYVGALEYDPYACVIPVLFSTNGDMPGSLISSREYAFCATKQTAAAGWKTLDFTLPAQLGAHTPFWFGIYARGMGINFDYGAACFDIYGGVDAASVRNDTQNGLDVHSRLNGIEENIALYRENSEDADYGMDMRSFLKWEGMNVHPLADSRYDVKLSIYFRSGGTDYTRILTQGVTLNDSRKLTGNYRRSATQTVRGTAAVTGFEGFYRSLVQTVTNTMALKVFPTLIRKLIQEAGASDRAQRFVSLLRKPAQTAGAAGGTQRISQAKRYIADTGKPETVIGRKQDFRRDVAHTGNAGTEVLKKADYVKRFEETAGSTASTGAIRDVVLRIVEAVAALYEMQAGTGFGRSVTDSTAAGSAMGGMVLFFRTLSGHAGSGDSTGRFITRMRIIEDRGTIGDDTGHTANYLRGLFVEAGSIAETKHRAEYHRRQQDTAGSEAVPLRHLFIFIRLLTGAYIRDFIIGRFLKSREEVIIKSPVCRELILDSKVH
jgi:hypothetical protein